MTLQKEQLMAMDPKHVAAHLRQTGWREHRKVYGKGTVWLLKNAEGQQFEIMLPTNKELGDFAIRMSEALHTLSIVESRDSQDLIESMSNGTTASGNSHAPVG